MIRFTSKIGPLTFLFFSFMVALNVCLVMLWGIFGIWIPFAIISAINILFVFPPFFGTYYRLTESSLKITSFWFCVNKKIAYEDIVVAVPKQKFGFFPALSCDGIEIVYMKNGVTKQTFVSPAMFETFLNQLTDNVLITNVMKADKASMSPETKQYLLKKQEIEEEKARKLEEEKTQKQSPKNVIKQTTQKATKTKTASKAKQVEDKPKTVKKTVKITSKKQ